MANRFMENGLVVVGMTVFIRIFFVRTGLVGMTVFVRTGLVGMTVFVRTGLVDMTVFVRTGLVV